MLYCNNNFYTELPSRDNEAARRKLRRRITNTLRKPTTMPTKLAKEGDLVLCLNPLWRTKAALSYIPHFNTADNFINNTI